jgi:hypothetical protein
MALKRELIDGGEGRQDWRRQGCSLGPRLRRVCLITQACVAPDGVTPHWSRCASTTMLWRQKE